MTGPYLEVISDVVQVSFVGPLMFLMNWLLY